MRLCPTISKTTKARTMPHIKITAKRDPVSFPFLESKEQRADIKDETN